MHYQHHAHAHSNAHVRTHAWAHTYKHRSTETGRQLDRQLDRQADRQTDRLVRYEVKSVKWCATVGEPYCLGPPAVRRVYSWPIGTSLTEVCCP